MSKSLYLECYSGISGDMTVAALIDLGADKEALLRSLESLKISGFKIEISRVKKSGIDACDFNVILDEHHENHDHDMEYLHGHNVKVNESKECNEEHCHKDMNHEIEHAHHHEHKGLPEILEIIYSSDITENAKNTAVKIFKIIAKAEAEAHGSDINSVHFHEVGAVDSIVDIVAVAVCLDDLEISDVVVTELYEGRGTIKCQHGIIPVPVPAVVNIIQSNNLNINITETYGELITPTGAAIVAAVKTKDKLPAPIPIFLILNFLQSLKLRKLVLEQEREIMTGQVSFEQ